MFFLRLAPHACLLAAAAAGLAGCNSSGAQRSFTTIGKPAMPTVAPHDVEAARVEAPGELRETILRRARAGDFTGAASALQAVQDGAERIRWAGELAHLLTQEEAARGRAFVAALPEGATQHAAVEAAARVLVPRDADAALRWAMGESSAGLQRETRVAVGGELARADPRAAVARIKGLTAGPPRDDLLVAAASAWARTDADAAVAWLRDQPDDALWPRLISSVGLAIAQTRPDRAVGVAEMLPAGRERWLLVSSIAQTWVAIDTKAAMAWAGQLPPGEARDAAFAGADTGLGLPQRRRVAGVPGTRSGSSRTRGGAGAMVSLADATAAPDFNAWLATQPPGMSKDEAILEYVRQRAATQPQVIGQWLTTLPGGPNVDRAKEIYLENVIPTAPAEAARWLRSIPRSERTDAMTEATAKRWLQTSPDAAAAWLQDTTLPAYVKERLLRDAGR